MGSAYLCMTRLFLQISTKLQAEQERLRKMQGVISTDAEAEKCLSGMLENLHRRLVGLVSAAPEVSAGDHKARDLHVAPRVNEMLEKYTDEVHTLPYLVKFACSSCSTCPSLQGPIVEICTSVRFGC